MDFVDVDADYVAVGGGQAGAGQDERPDLSDYQRAEQAGGFRAQGAAVEGYQDDAPPGEQLGQVNAGLGLAQHGSQVGTDQKGLQLVEHRGDPAQALGVGELVVLGPELVGA